MSAFKDYYLVSVEKELGRSVTEVEAEEAKQLYIKGWHPARTAERLTQLAHDAGESAASQALSPQSGESTPEVVPAATQRR